MLDMPVMVARYHSTVTPAKPSGPRFARPKDRLRASRGLRMGLARAEEWTPDRFAHAACPG
jgi:hypothetical protein